MLSTQFAWEGSVMSLTQSFIFDGSNAYALGAGVTNQ
jgi:hypothetical protein